MLVGECGRKAGVRARFRVNVLCANCQRTNVHDLAVPDAEDAPDDIDSLVESAFLQRRRFVCPKCESSIGLVAAIRQMDME